MMQQGNATLPFFFFHPVAWAVCTVSAQISEPDQENEFLIIISMSSLNCCCNPNPCEKSIHLAIGCYENHNSTMIVQMFQGYIQLNPHCRLSCFHNFSGCFEGHFSLSRVKLRGRERDKRGPWTTIMLPSKFIVADKCTHKSCGYPS